MITRESITKKLGFDPMTWKPKLENEWMVDDSQPNPFDILTTEELNWVMKEGIKYQKAQHRES